MTKKDAEDISKKLDRIQKEVDLINDIINNTLGFIILLAVATLLVSVGFYLGSI